MTEYGIPGMTGRITRSEDFERVLRSSSQARSPHFAVHHLANPPSRPKKTLPKPLELQLSTGCDEAELSAVDETSHPRSNTEALTGVWLGVVVPKRHAKRAVTRTLLKRQIKAAMARQGCVLPGLWVVRLRAPFDRSIYISAASNILAQAARDELTRVLMSATKRCTTV